MEQRRGTERREIVQDANAGAAAGNVAISSVPQGKVLTPRPRGGAAQVGRDARMAGQLAQFVGGELQELADKKFAQDRVQGAVAFQQGKTLEDLDAEGAAPHTIAGYRMMDAQTAASEMYQQQVAAIEAVDYERTPDEFRAELSGRLEAVLDGKDSATASLITELAVQQMPKLAELHMRSHQDFLSRETFRSLSDAVANVSMDPTSHDTLKFMASGVPGSPAASMSVEKRQEALVNGIQKAFANDNPMAFAVLNNSGALKDLSPKLRGALETARNSYEQRTRRVFDKEYMDLVNGATNAVRAGSMDLNTALAKIAGANAKRGWRMTTLDAGGLYTADNTRQAALLRAQEAAAEDEERKANEIAEGRANLDAKLKLDALAEGLADGMDPDEYVRRAMEIVEGAKGHLGGSDITEIAGTLEAQRKTDAKAVEDAEQAAQEEQDEAAKQAAADQAVQAQITYDDLMRPVRVKFESGAMSVEEFDAAQMEAMRKSGLTLKQQAPHIKRANQRVVQRVVEEWKAHAKTVTETTAIETAIARGMVTELPANLQQRAFDIKRAELNEKYADQLNDPTTAVEAQAAMQSDMIEFMATAGVTDKGMKDRLNNALTLGPIGPDGKPTDAAVSAFEYLIELQQKNPIVADKYLNAETRPLFTMAQTLNTNGSVGGREALQQAALALQTGDEDRVSRALNRPDVREQVNELTSDWMQNQSIGIIGALLDGNSEVQQRLDILGTDEAHLQRESTRLTSIIDRQARALMIRNPGLSAEAAVKMAGQDMDRRAAVFGGDLIILPEGQNVRELMFGNRHGDFDMTAIPNNALMRYLRKFGGTKQMWGKDFNDTNLFDAIGAFFGSVVGDSENDPLADLVDTQIRGVPKLVVRPDNGIYGAEPGLFVQYYRSDGTLSPDARHIRYKDLGDLWIAEQINRLD